MNETKNSHPPRVPTKAMIKHGLSHWNKIDGLPNGVNLLQSWIAMHDYWYRVEQFKVRQQEIAEHDRRNLLHLVR